MKTILLTLVAAFGLVFLANTSLQAQNLAFDGVQYLEWGGLGTTGSGAHYFDTTFTVPANKVWKITSVYGSPKDTSYFTPTGLLNGTTSSYGIAISLNNVVIMLNTGSASSGSLLLNAQPIWLPPGSYTLRLRTPRSGSAGPFRFYGLVTAIQFDTQ
ncbi:MAG: hypothetical protein H6581_23645 [Bacteroidia bacterium]|nr:hypothetical protein [Bacteroidia bacterium]